MSNVSFPPEVLENILSRLPVKSLLQYRSVSKSLRAIIDSPFFINLHSQQSVKTDKVLARFKGVGSLTFICSFYMDPHPRCVRLETPFDVSDFPQIIGSCHGLMCFSTGTINRELLFWNPSTRKHKPIPTPIHYPPNEREMVVCDHLGYDHVNDDYKVVRLSIVSEPVETFRIIVYSMRLNTWRLVEHGLPSNLIPVCCSGDGVCVSGVINYLINRNSRNPERDLDIVIVAFDLASQSFSLVSVPECCNSYKALHLGILGGCLHVVGKVGMFDVDIWVMGEYGVKESWKKLVAWTTEGRVGRARPYVKPIMYLKNGREVLLKVDEQWFVIYDVEDNEPKDLWSCNPCCLSTFFYRESLVF